MAHSTAFRFVAAFAAILSRIAAGTGMRLRLACQRREHLVARAEHRDGSLAQEHDMIGRAQKIGLMADENDRAAALLQLLEHVEQRHLAFAVEAGVRLVENDQRWIAKQRTCERDALALAARDADAVGSDLGPIPFGSAGSSRGCPQVGPRR
ncbi:hypothetical protein NKJ89_30135 [Mesorhizobium sp. M0047]